MENQILKDHKECYERILVAFMRTQGTTPFSLSRLIAIKPDPGYVYHKSVVRYQPRIVEGMVCPKCKCEKKLTKHHVFKSAIFGKNGRNDILIYLCRHCHDKLEIKITEMEGLILMQHKPAYVNLYTEFMGPTIGNCFSPTKSLGSKKAKS